MDFSGVFPRHRSSISFRLRRPLRLRRPPSGTALAATALLLFAATDATAFDGRRTGFILGGGFGGSMTSFTQEISFGAESVESDRESKGGFASDFKIGGGINERTMLYYANRLSWFGLENALGSDVTIANGVGLLGLSYYLQDAAPCPYLVGTIGIATWDAPFEEDSEAWTGFGAGLGAGYEFSPHWSVEGTLNFGNPSTEESGLEASANAFCFLLTFSGVAY